MSVSNVTSGAGLSQLNWRSGVRQARQDFEQLFQAMQAGDLSSAQQAYAGLQQLMPGTATSTASGSGAADATAGATGSSTTTSSTTSATAATTNTIAGDWSSLGQALQSGSLSSAQSAFSQLEQDLQAKAQGAGHRHHHHEVEQAQALYSAMQVGNATAAAGTGNPANAVGSDISALKQALQSGDTASAQKLLAQLQNDLQASGQASGQAHGHHHHRGFALQTGAAAYTDPAVSATTASTTTVSGPSSTATA